ncbi:S9 family peptidase [Aquitalea sp. LB_tupeE]|uniref:alpha/beta hydrolase family protein n=1 Tax=Aquitalea sp. LB_tupeE TaxID=2748078 RepID=UPI0015C10F81|nr:alpha/beta fold hydrolase [Aquitalea sp. LB_tupeE]NWK77525.1 alpha/beta fold hydrolase [Aquitalea sp. LB_tupeE]
MTSTCTRGKLAVLPFPCTAMSMFPLPCGDHLLHGDHLHCPQPRAHLLLLHGAGNGQRAPFLPLRQTLQQQDIASTAFDFVGHGETGGSLMGSSLAHRVHQAKLVLAASGLHTQPLALLGSSMGAYIAIRLLSEIQCSHLILQVPGVYTPAAFTVPFGPAFSTVLRQPDSWQKSDAWDRLAGFRGHLLLVEAEHDAVIPRALTERLYASATKAKSRSRLLIDGAGHLLAAHWQAHPDAARRYQQHIARFLLQD